MFSVGGSTSSIRCKIIVASGSDLKCCFIYSFHTSAACPGPPCLPHLASAHAAQRAQRQLFSGGRCKVVVGIPGGDCFHHRRIDCSILLAREEEKASTRRRGEKTRRGGLFTRSASAAGSIMLTVKLRASSSAKSSAEAIVITSSRSITSAASVTRPFGSTATDPRHLMKGSDKAVKGQ